MSRDIKAILHIKKYNELFNIFMVAIIVAAMAIALLLGISFVYNSNIGEDDEKENE